MIGGKFAPHTISNSEDIGIDTMITTFNTAELSCSITRPMEIISTDLFPDIQRTTTPSFAKKWRLQYNQ